MVCDVWVVGGDGFAPAAVGGVDVPFASAGAGDAMARRGLKVADRESSDFSLGV